MKKWVEAEDRRELEFVGQSGFLFLIIGKVLRDSISLFFSLSPPHSPLTHTHAHARAHTHTHSLAFPEINPREGEGWEFCMDLSLLDMSS